MPVTHLCFSRRRYNLRVEGVGEWAQLTWRELMEKLNWLDDHGINGNDVQWERVDHKAKGA